ncbi:unnamed protein product, partial [Adineta ricciae]
MDHTDFDCLYYYVPSDIVDMQLDVSIKQVIKYCIRPTNNQLSNFEGKYYRNSTFEQLRYLNVTIEALLSWSASVDLVEQYSVYINDPLRNDVLSNELFSNCTEPWFGSHCQYSFNYNNKQLFTNIVQKRFHPSEEFDFDLMNLTGYSHLECDRGGKDLCLDWREICNVQIDCLNGGIDEKECFQMEMNECEEDEYRCHNGLCIPKDFWKDDPNNPDCLDRSDESSSISFDLCYQNPSFRCEEHGCRAGEKDFPCGDGQCVKQFGHCKNRRNDLLRESLLTKDNLSYECWLYLVCFSLVSEDYDSQLCDSTLRSFSSINSDLSMCEPLVQFPTKYALLGHIRFLYQEDQRINYTLKMFMNGQLMDSHISLSSLYQNIPTIGSNIFNHIGLVVSPINDNFYFGIDSKPYPTFGGFNLLSGVHSIGSFPSYVFKHNPGQSYFGPALLGNYHFLQAIYFRVLLPDLVCYDQSLCPFFLPSFRHKNFTCRHLREFNFTGIMNYNQFLLAIKHFFHSCRTTYDAVRFHSSLYCCANSTKCISKHRLLDGIHDCYLNDDETYNLSCSLNDKFRFKCSGKENFCFSPIIDDDNCESYLKTNINDIEYQDICNGINDLSDDGQTSTDETECHHWPCDNIYTRCDGVWACPNGEDEQNCVSFECPPTSYPCITLEEFNVTCLPMEKMNDGNIDCFGASDELNYCRKDKSNLMHGNMFHCSNSPQCIPASYLCNNENDCPFLHNHDELFCDSKRSPCSEHHDGNRTDNERILCEMFKGKDENKFFTLKGSSEYPLLRKKHSSKLSTKHSQITANDLHDKHEAFLPARFCHRGIHADISNNAYVCFCPPSYYGSNCQYQNDRVSLTLRILPINRESIYTVLVKLIDGDDLINSYEQFTFMSNWGCKIKFNIYLLYLNRSKDLSKNYSIHIDVFEKNSLDYYTSWFLPIPFLFLPVNRIVSQLNLAVQRSISLASCNLTCLNNGQCMKYENTNRFFCQCLSNYSGNQCERVINCNDCSKDSICVGALQNRSICICPANKAGPRCLLPSKCPLNACQNHGRCVLLDNIIGTKNYMCICSEEFYGLNCEFQKNRLTIFFHEMDIPSYIQVYVTTISNQSQPTNLVL